MVARLTGGQEVVGSNPVIPTMYTFVIILSVLAVLLLVSIVLTYRSKKPIVSSTRRLMISALFPVIANIIITLSENYNLSEVGYLIYFISTDWLLIYAVRFVTEYCGYPYRGTWLERTLGMLGGIDFIMLLGNHWFHNAFGLSEVVLENGHIYYKYYSLWYHGIHLAFSYFMTAALVILLIMKLTHTAAIYREKYFVMLGTVLVIGVWELYYVVNKSILEYSMISYAVLPVIVAFFALVYKPYFATYRMFKEVMLNISEAIFFNDDKNDCIYINRRAKEILDYVGKSQEEAWDYAVEVLAGGDVYVMEDIMNEGYFQALRNYTFGEESFTFELELQKLTDKKGRYVGSFITAKDRTEEQKRLDKERYQATHDSLTGLYNADYLYTRIEKMLMEDPNHRYVIVASDIKSFKMVNDVYGRKVGDEILINIARQIEALSTKYTIYGRIGSDKFGLIMRRENFSESLFNTQVKKVTMLNTEMIYPIVIHVGVYEVTDRRIPVSVMFDRAYMALMTIKNDMQKRVAYYDSNLREDMLWEQRIAGSIDVGLEQNQIVPYLQSQVLSDGTIIGAEMLARWQHPTEGFLKPRRFLPTLEKNGYVVRLDQFMWEQACRTIKRWEESGWDELYISVNISPVDFFFMDVVDEFCNLIKKYDVEPGKLRLEITENTMMYDAKRRIESIEKLREHGFMVEMDDFGNGFSSLNMLKDIPLDVIKIDMAFLEETRDEERAREILESMISLAKRLEIPVITEGVETKEQLDFLTEMGCDMFQGYYFSRAVPISEFEHRYANSLLGDKGE